MLGNTLGSNLDQKVLVYWLERGELLPEILEMTPDYLEEFLGTPGFPPELDRAIRELMFPSRGR